MRSHLTLRSLRWHFPIQIPIIYFEEEKSQKPGQNSKKGRKIEIEKEKRKRGNMYESRSFFFLGGTTPISLKEGKRISVRLTM